jgi:hypothetical protein
MAKRLLTLSIFAMLFLAACASNAGGDPSAGGGVVVDNTNPVEWDRNPNTVVFRADVVGGSGDAFLKRNQIPPCTVYGDNHVLWTNELGPFDIQVLEDRLTDDQMREFVNYVALNQQFYKYPERQDNAPAEAVSPVVETLTLFINNVAHVTDAFSGWPTDYYPTLMKSCKDISIAPAIYEPTAAWVSAQVIEYDPTSPGIVWDATANGLKLADLATSGERKWLTDRNVRVIWNILRTSPPSVMFTEDNIPYHVAVEIPNITRESPPAQG